MQQALSGPVMNPDLDRLLAYPFERLRMLLAECTPPQDRPRLSLAVGEPQHAPPELALNALVEHRNQYARYPSIRGGLPLRQAAASWLTSRYGLPCEAVDPEHQILVVNGSREGLFAIAQTVVDRTRDDATVVVPNPFYQIYEGAALMAGATPWYMNADADGGLGAELERVPDAVWARCQLVYLCSPNNPTGAVASLADLQRLIGLAERFDFVVVADECYAEIYSGEAPPGLLQAAARMGRPDFARCLVFHSLSKRSNLAGLRSGFVAGDAALIEAFARYRSYHGCSMPGPSQAASIAAWGDEEHVRANRALYRDKFAEVVPSLSQSLSVRAPQGGFCLWAATPVDDETLTRALFEQEHIVVLPGRYLARTAHGVNPGVNHVRLALVHERAVCRDAAERICRVVDGLVAG